jgi:hypothetical protein
MLAAVASAQQPIAAVEGAPKEGVTSNLAERAKVKLDKETFEFFRGEISQQPNPQPDHVLAYAIVKAKVESVNEVLYCPNRAAGCGENPTCSHPKQKRSALTITVGETLFSSSDAALPKEFRNYLYFGNVDLAKGDEVILSLHVYKHKVTKDGNSHISKIKKRAAAVEEDVAFFEKKYQRKITGVKPKGEYSDPDQFYSAIGQQLGIPELAWKAAAEKYGWKKDYGRNTFTMLKGGPTAGGGQGTWDVMFIRSTINPETKKPDPASMEEVMVQIDYDGNIKMLERKVKNMRPFVRELEKKREVVK